MEHLVGIAERLPDLRSIHLTGAVRDDYLVKGPDTEELLEEQRQILLQAVLRRPSLEEVSFKNDVLWNVDANGHWTAVYHASSTRSLVVLSPLDYLQAEPVIGSSCGE